MNILYKVYILLGIRTVKRIKQMQRKLKILYMLTERLAC